jgi:hypothetical protein
LDVFIQQPGKVSTDPTDTDSIEGMLNGPDLLALTCPLLFGQALCGVELAHFTFSKRYKLPVGKTHSNVKTPDRHAMPPAPPAH